MDPLEYVKKKYWDHKIGDGANGQEIIIKACPSCKDTGHHFYINSQTGVFFCHKCQKAGSLYTLKADMGDLANPSRVAEIKEEDETLDNQDQARVFKAHADLLLDKEMLLYLAERNFSQEAVAHFQLGMSVEDNKKWLWMPYINGVGEVVNVKKRVLPPHTKEFRRWVGRDSILFNEKALALPTDHIIITEGETDCISLYSAGLENVVGVPTGAKGLNPKWIQQLDKYQKVYIAYDNDQAGYEGTYILANRLGVERCHYIQLPPGVKDINEYFQGGRTLEDFKKLMVNSPILDVQYVNSLGQEIERFIHNKWVNKTKEEDALVIPWKGLQSIINGFYPGDLIVAASMPGMGKSSLAINFLYEYSRRGIPTLLFSLEMSPARLMPRFAARHLGIDSREVGTFELMRKFYDEVKNYPMYLAYVYKKPQFEFVADTIRMCVRRYGIKFVVFDNLHFLIRSMNDVVRETSFVIQGFKLLAEELGIPIFVIARPRKTKDKMISNQDLKDSADIEGDSDIIILIHRDFKEGIKNDTDYLQEGTFKEEAFIRVSKCRYAAGGQIWMKFKDAICLT